MPRPPIPPCTLETATQKLRLAAGGRWLRSCGNESWAFDGQGPRHTRIASINDLEIAESERLYRWPAGHRPADHAGLTELGL